LLLSGLTAPVSRLALVGLAKNTGKTEALAALLRELETEGRRVGVTSVGRDGEERDVIDVRIEKPRVRLPPGSLVATTDGLLRASGLPHELLEQTGVRTPLGRVSIARVAGGGVIEVAGPSASTDVRAVSDAMLRHGAEQVLIDGAIDRRAASSPEVSDGLVMATGAILSSELHHVVARTAEAVALVRLPGLDPADPESGKVRDAAATLAPGAGAELDENLAPHPLPERFVLTAEPADISARLRSGPPPRWLVVSGALPERFLDGLVGYARRRSEPLKVLASDPTRVFLSDRGVDHYARAGVELRVRKPIDLLALTVNPVAPQSHSFDSAELRRALAEAIPGVPIFDVLDPSYASGAPLAHGARGAPA
jgi:hypothetical protein